MAIASLITSILGFCVPLLGIVGVILGILGLQKASRPGGTNKGVAIAGLVIGCVSTLSLVVWIAILLPSLSRARDMAQNVRCLSNLKQIGTAIQMYSLDNRGQMPTDLNSLTTSQYLLQPTPVFACAKLHPGATTSNPAAPDYVYTLQNKPTRLNSLRNASNFVIVYEPIANHGSWTNLLFADGHAEMVKEPRASAMIKAIQGGQNPPP